MLETCSPARLKVLLGAVHTTQRCASSGTTCGNTWCTTPSRVKSQWISSEITLTPCLAQISPMRRSSSSRHTRPTGLCGLHSRKALTFCSAALRSKSAKSISYLPSR